MSKYTLTHLRDDVLLRDLSALIARDRFTTALLLAYVAEVDTRKLYVAAGHPSMFAYCTEHLHLSESAAYRHITAARAARRFPALFSAIAEGQLHLTAVCMLAAHFTQDNLGELVKAATHQGRKEIDSMLARRFAATYPFAIVPPPVPAKIRALPVRTYTPQLSPERVPVKNLSLLDSTEGASPQVESESPTQAESSSRETPASPAERYLVQFTIEKSDRDLLQHAHALLSHAAPSAEVTEVFVRALRFYVKHLEKQRYGAVPRKSRVASKTEAGKTEARAAISN